MKKTATGNDEAKKLKELLSNNKLVLLEVRETCCSYSYLIDSIIEKIENEFDNNIRIARTDYETYKKLFREIEIESFPTVLLINNKNVFKKINGTISRTNLKNLANELLENHCKISQ